MSSIALAQREKTSLSWDLNSDLPYRKPARYQLSFALPLYCILLCWAQKINVYFP
jgi:hypothetical protein